MAERKARILSTKDLEPGLIREAADRGITIEVIPMISTSTVDDRSLEGELRELTEKELVAVFTSVNAVEGVYKATSVKLQAASGIAEAPIGDPKIVQRMPWKIFCIGGATSRLVRKYFGEASIAGEAAAAAELAEVIIGTLRAASYELRDRRTEEVDNRAINEVFFFCGDRRREELLHRLEEASIRVRELVVYRTDPLPTRIGEGYQAILFFSPSGVDSFFSINGTQEDILFFAIGNTTAEAIRKYTGKPVHVAPAPDRTALIRQVIDHFTL